MSERSIVSSRQKCRRTAPSCSASERNRRPRPVFPPRRLDAVSESSAQKPAPPESAPETEVPAGGINWRLTALAVISIAVTIALLRYMQEVFVPLAIGTLLFYALDPLVDGMQRWRIPRALGAIVALG